MASIIKSNTYADFNGREILTANNDGALTTQKILYPAFHVRRSSDSGQQSVASDTWTKAQLNAEDYDTNNAFDSSTNYEFKPTIPGLYYFYWNARFGTGTDFNSFGARIYRNSNWVAEGNVSNYHFDNQQVTVITRLNGSTDTVQFWVRQNSGAARNLDGDGGGNDAVTYAGGFRIGS